MQSPVYTYTFSTPRSALNIFCPPSPHQYLFFPFLSCFQPFLLASRLTRTWGVMRHQTEPACLSCNARIKQRSGKLICFPRCSFVTWWDRHWDIQSMGMKLVKKQDMSKAGRCFFFFRHFPEVHLHSFFWNYIFTFKDWKPPLIAAYIILIHISGIFVLKELSSMCKCWAFPTMKNPAIIKP